jgi:hypothetical protein
MSNSNSKTYLFLAVSILIINSMLKTLHSMGYLFKVFDYFFKYHLNFIFYFLFSFFILMYYGKDKKTSFLLTATIYLLLLSLCTLLMGIVYYIHFEG